MNHHDVVDQVIAHLQATKGFLRLHRRGDALDQLTRAARKIGRLVLDLGGHGALAGGEGRPA